MTTNPTDTDVLVIGAGPTGLTLALALHGQGVKVRLVDRLARPAGVSKALAVWSGSLEAFAGLGVAEAFVTSGTPLDALKIGTGGRLLASVPTAAGLDTPFPPMLVPQWRTEAILAGAAAERGVAVERGVELQSLAQDDDTVVATLRHADGSSEEVRVSYLVGADGARSAVRRSLGVAFEGYAEPDVFILGDVRITGGNLDPRSVYLWWREGGTVALFPFEPSIWRIFAVRRGTQDEAQPTLAELQSAVDRHGPPGVRLHDAQWLSAFRTNERLAARFRVGRVFLAGDAAHIHTPAGGQGMNIGVQDAVNLGWKLGAVLAGRGEADILLGSYEAERRPIAKATIESAARRLHLAMSAGRPAMLLRTLAAAALARLPVAQRALRVQLAETDIAYREGPLVALGDPPRHPRRTEVGGRARDIAFVDPQRGTTCTLWPMLAGGHHTLLVFGETEAGAVDRYAPFAGPEVTLVRLDSKSDPDGAAHKRYRMRGPGWVLIRPDQFVAARGSAGDLGQLANYLARVVAPTPD